MARSLPFLILVATGCTASVDPAGSAAEDLASARYVDVLDYWTDAPQDAWLDAVDNVVKQFDRICGDTFCGGDYSDIRSLELTCSVSASRGNVKSCSWTFAGSAAVVRASSGSIATSAPTFACTFAPTGTAGALRTAFAAAGSLQARLPGLSKSLYDVLGDCLAHPIGGSTIPSPGTGPYTDVLDGLAATEQNRWITMTAALDASFRQLCDAGLCTVNRPWLAPLRLDCSMRSTTHTLDQCVWAFGEGGARVSASTGKITTSAHTTLCKVPVSGKAEALAAALGGPGATDALHRPLPGGTATLGDVLSACLR